MKLLLTPILITPLLLAACADPEPTLADQVENWNGDPNQMDEPALSAAIDTPESRASIAAAVAANPVIDVDSVRAAYPIHVNGEQLLWVQVDEAGISRDFKIYLIDPATKDVPPARVASLDIDGDDLTLLLEFNNDPADIAKYDISLANGGPLRANIYTGEVIAPDPTP